MPSTDDGHTSDATYRFGFREATQNGDYYYLNGVRVNFRGDNLQGADYDRINNGGKGDAYDTLPGFLPPSPGNGGWPQAVDNYQRLNYNVVRIHQEPASPYMLDVADEMGLMIIDETAIRGSQSGQDWIAGHDNMVNHARALVLRDRNHPAVIRWSQANEPNQSGQDSEQFEKDLYAAMNGADGTRPVIVELGVGANVNRYPGMTYANFAVIPHYVDGFGRYGEGLITVNGRPDGEGEYIWPACNNKQGFEWFATATLAKRGKDATDLRPYTLLSAWASVVPGVRTTDFTPEEGGHPIYGADNLPDPWSNPQIQRVQAAFNPVAAVDLPVLVGLRRLGLQRHLPAAAGGTQLRPQRHGDPQHHRLQRRPHQHLGGLHLDRPARQPDRHGRRVRQHHPDHPARLAGHPAGVLHHPRHRQPRVPAAVDHEVRQHRLHRRGRVLHPRRKRRNRTRTRHLPHRQPQQRQAPRHRRQLHRRRRQGGPAERHPHVDDQHHAGRLHPALHRLRKGARRQRRQQHGRACNCSSGRPTAAPTRCGTCGPPVTATTPSSAATADWLADVYGASTSDGAQVVQWTANGGTNQQWQFVPA